MVKSTKNLKASAMPPPPVPVAVAAPMPPPPKKEILVQIPMEEYKKLKETAD